jgi:hypothetical protein
MRPMEKQQESKSIIIRPQIGNILLLFLHPYVLIFIIFGPITLLASPGIISKMSGIFIIILMITLILVYVVINKNRRLIIYPIGIEYSEIGYKVFARWKDIIAVRVWRKIPDRIYLSRNVIITDNKIFIFRKSNKEKRIIGISQFDTNWENTEWGQFICSKSRLKYWRNKA